MHEKQIKNLVNDFNQLLNKNGYTSKIKFEKKKPIKHSKRHFELSCIFGRINRKGQPISLSDKKYVDYFEKFSVPVYNIRELSNTDGLSVQHRCNEKRRDVQIRYAKHGYKMVSWSIVEL